MNTGKVIDMFQAKGESALPRELTEAIQSIHVDAAVENDCLRGVAEAGLALVALGEALIANSQLYGRTGVDVTGLRHALVPLTENAQRMTELGVARVMDMLENAWVAAQENDGADPTDATSPGELDTLFMKDLRQELEA